MKADNRGFHALLQKFFLQWLMTQKSVSPETVKSYRDSFKLFIKYLETVHKIKPPAITVNCLDAEHIIGFLDYLDKERKNQTKTINNRLSAVLSFLRFLSFELPEYSALVNRSLMIPFRKAEKRTMDFLTKDEYQALQESCALASELGRRDKLMLFILYNTGVRVSELVGLKNKDVIRDSNGLPSYVHIHGKGRKERDVPLWKTTASYLRKYMESHDSEENEKLFMNRADGGLTRSGVRYRLGCLVRKASAGTPSIRTKNITPHTFRHSVALNLLQSGVDISTIAIWLGHESILTTHKYMEADMEMKRRTLEKIQEPGEMAYCFKPDDTVLAFLDSL
jgi:site-specific recombinase XerD